MNRPPAWLRTILLDPAMTVAWFSLMMLAVALAFEQIGGIMPCPLCIQQRMAHLVALAAACLSIILRGRGATAAAAISILSLFAGIGIAVWHVGIQYGWWAASCGLPVNPSMDAEAFRRAIMEAVPVPCDVITWSFLGISMAGWNGILSLAVATWSLGAMIRRIRIPHGGAAPVNPWAATARRRFPGF